MAFYRQEPTDARVKVPARRVVNVGSSGAAFVTEDGVAGDDVAEDDRDLTILQLLQATNRVTDEEQKLTGFASIYDRNGDGQLDESEIELRRLAHELYRSINDDGSK